MADTQDTTATTEHLLTWEIGAPNEEAAHGFAEGMRTAKWEVPDQATFLRLLRALDVGRYAFVHELQRSAVMTGGPGADLGFDDLEDFLFGAGSGGISGDYANGFVSAFALVRPFVTSLH